MVSSLRRSHPDAAVTLLLVDLQAGELDDMTGVQLIGLDSLLGEDGGLISACNSPDALDLALLPALARVALDGGDGSVVYIGAGQRILGKLDQLLELQSAHQVVLVAREVDDLHPAGAFDARRSGAAFSTQIVALRDGPETAALLADWPRCFAGGDVGGRSAVSAWLEGIPARIEDVGVLRAPGYALEGSALASAVHGGADASGEDPFAVRFDGARTHIIDFGELDPDHPPQWLDRDQRVPTGAVPVVQQVIADHAAELRGAGWGGRLDPPFTRLSDGLRLTPTIRSIFTEALASGELTRSPFAEPGRAALHAYLMQPVARGRASGLSRVHIAIWQARPDLQSAYPHIDGPDGAGFAGWLCQNGIAEEGLVAELLPPAPDLAFRDADPHIHEGSPRWGVNVVGFFTAELGVGEAARLLLAGLDAQSVPALPIQGRLMPPSRQGVDFAYARPDEAAYPINIICVNGDGVPVFAREAGRSFFDRRYTIALWWWEVGVPPPSWKPAYDFVDEVWVASQYIYDALAPGSPAPVVRVRLPVITPDVADRTREQLGMPTDGFTFLCVYDYHSVAMRKNPLGVVHAYRRAFPAGAGTKLVLKSINAQTHPGEHARVALAAADRDDITLIDGYVSSGEKNAMIAACDCYVSLHRSEGFGIALAEAMLLAKPVIATGYGGPLEFMTRENAYLVDWEPVEVGEGAYPYDPHAVWAEPSIDHAAALMRHLFTAPEEARSRGDRARLDVLAHHSPEAAGAVMRSRLELLHERLYENGARALNLAHLQALSREDELRSLIAKPPVPDFAHGILGRLESRAHRPMASWARAYVNHQRTIDDETQLEVGRIDERVRELGAVLQEQQKAQHAETLAVLRRLEARLEDLSPDESAG